MKFQNVEYFFYLQSFRDNAGCDKFVCGDFFVEFVVGVLVKQNQVVQFVPGFSLRPLLLLGLATASPFLLLGVLGRSFGGGLGILFGSHLCNNKKIRSL